MLLPAPAIECIGTSLHETLNATDLIAKSATDLQNQAAGLLEVVAFFHYSESTLPGKVPVRQVELRVNAAMQRSVTAKA